MDEKLRTDYNDPDAIPGVISKVASISPLEVTDEDLKKINKYTLRTMTKEDVFVFKVTMADNEQDDRNFMPFNLKALQDLKRLYPGKTMLKDHSRRADNQIGRVFEADLVQNPNEQTELGELYTELVGKVYMIRTESNKDFITEVEGGIKKEVSTSTVANKLVCNICKGDGRKCRHWPGIEYTVEDGSPTGTKKRCKLLIDGAKEAHELSFVAVPAQPRAGTHKCVGFAKDVAEIEEETPVTETKNNNVVETDARLLSLRLKNAESFFNVEREEK